MSSKREELLRKHQIELAEFDRVEDIKGSLSVEGALVSNVNTKYPWISYKARTLLDAVAILRACGSPRDVYAVRERGCLSLRPDHCAEDVLEHKTEAGILLDSRIFEVENGRFQSGLEIYMWSGDFRFGVDVHMGPHHAITEGCWARNGKYVFQRFIHPLPQPYSELITWGGCGRRSSHVSAIYSGFDHFESLICGA